MSSPPTILTINVGSSSVKLATFAGGRSRRSPHREFTGSFRATSSTRGRIRVWDLNGRPWLSERTDHAEPAKAVTRFLTWFDGESGRGPADVIGHRIVHGGEKFLRPSVISASTLRTLRQLRPLDPDHLPAEIRAIEASRRAAPGTLHVACFDTTFHRTMPPRARCYGIPWRLTDEGVRRYGFHGLSYEFIVGELARLTRGRSRGQRILVAHLGSGASLCAIHNNRSVDTTMGFTPTSGLVMSTRCGDLDPSVVLYLAERKGLSPSRIRRLLNSEAGLLGVSGTTSDMERLLARSVRDDRARAAVELFCFQVQKYAGALFTVLGGLDQLVFTAGIGEHAAEIRHRVCDGLRCVGVRLDARKNARHAAVISSARSSVEVRVIPTNEEQVIADHARRLWSAQRRPTGTP